MEITKKSYFFDSYAFFEIIKGNQNYNEISEDVNILTTKLNLMELYYWLLIRKGKELADFYFDRFKQYCTDVEDGIIKEAMEFRAKNKKRNLSYVDCIGYTIAKQMNVKFLTGDKEFEDMDNVKFIK